MHSHRKWAHKHISRRPGRVLQNINRHRLAFLRAVFSLCTGTLTVRRAIDELDTLLLSLSAVAVSRAARQTADSPQHQRSPKAQTHSKKSCRHSDSDGSGAEAAQSVVGGAGCQTMSGPDARQPSK